jgi:predicted DNA-binding ribbon-helix-helix protein
MTREARPAGAAIAKRSLLVAGHATSISLEDAFWVALKAAAARRGVAVATLVGAIDAERGTANLSSAIRVFLLREACAAPDLDLSDRDRKIAFP